MPSFDKPTFLSSLTALACLVACFSVSAVRGQEFVSPVDGDGHVIDFARDIAPIFKNRCLECHGPEDAKNDFRIDERDLVMDYIDAGDVESSLYVDYLAVDDEEMIMPPKAKGGPLSAGELALIRVWIAEGAIWPEGTEVTGEFKEKPPAPTSLIGRVWGFQGYFHPATVHFPIALLLFGAAFVVLGFKWPAVGTQIPLACLLFGALTSIAATAMGWSFAANEGYPGWTNFDMDNEFFWHRWGGVIVTTTSVILALVALRSLKTGSEKLTKIWKVGLLVCAAMVGMVGHQGGELTYGHEFYPKAFKTLLGTTDEPADATPAATEPAAAETAAADAARFSPESFDSNVESVMADQDDSRVALSIPNLQDRN